MADALVFGTGFATTRWHLYGWNRFQGEISRLVGSHMVSLIVGTLIMGAITGFVVSKAGVFFWGLAGQILHGLLTIVCFALVAFAFWRFGWKVGMIDLVLLFVAGNIGSDVTVI